MQIQSFYEKVVRTSLKYRYNKVTVIHLYSNQKNFLA